jgi:hypothetical protein
MVDRGKLQIAEPELGGRAHGATPKTREMRNGEKLRKRRQQPCVGIGTEI